MPGHYYGGGVVDYIGRALVADALEQWREQLRESAAASALRDVTYAEPTLIDLGDAHPGGLAPFFAGRPTLLSGLIRNPVRQRGAFHRGALIREHARRVQAATGDWTAALAVGTAAWTENGQPREVPLVLRPVGWDEARDGDAYVTMGDAVVLNPVAAALFKDRGIAEGLEQMLPSTGGGTAFDPRPLWDVVRERGTALGPHFEVRERLLLGVFDDPEQRLVDDLDDLGDALRHSDVIAAVAGDHDAAGRLAVPIPAFSTGDRDPFSERGLGDLDDAQFAALDVVATGRSVFVQTAPGADAVGTVVAIAADGAASGKSVLVVAGNAAGRSAVAARLEQWGAKDVAVEGDDEAWDASARASLLEAMTAGNPDVDDDRVREAGEALLAARRDVQRRFDALHRSYRPWDVSAFEAVQALVRLTSTDPAPVTTVRLGSAAAAVVAEHGFASVAAALVDAIASDVDEDSQGVSDVSSEPVNLVPWWSAVTDDPREGGSLDEALATLLMRHLPKLRAEAAIAAHETGLDEAISLAEWMDQVALFTDLRATLDIFSPAVFHRSLHDIVSATAPNAARESTLVRRDRRALTRRAVELLRPGRSKATLHADLQSAHQQSLRWRAMCSAGGWPAVPDDFDVFADRADLASLLWARIADAVGEVTGQLSLPERPWDEMIGALSTLAEGIPGDLEAVRMHPLERDLDDVGLGELRDDLRERRVDAVQARRDLEFAWWASAFDVIVAADARLTETGAIGAAVEEFLRADAAFSGMRVGPLLRAVAERRRTAIARHQDSARDLFSALVEGSGAPFRELWRDHTAVVKALRPVVLCQAEHVTRIAPPEAIVDTAVVIAAESLALAQLVPALARARQVVIVGDAEAATRSAVTALAALLPAVVIPALPQPRDPRVSAVLAHASYGRVIQALPAAGKRRLLGVTFVDAVGSPVAGHIGVESTRAEVMSVLHHVVSAARSLPRRSIAIIAGNDLHAGRVSDALAQRDPRLVDRIPVVSLGGAAGLDVDEVVLTPGYATDARGSVPRNVGVLGEDVGRRALTQALVATHERLTLVTSMTAEQWGDVADTFGDAEGVEGLRDLLVAASSPAVAPEPVEPGPADWLLSEIAARLRDEGYAVRVRYGQGADTIPLVAGGKHERTYRVAVVTDESPMGQSVSVRDRVRRQQASLEALGWVVIPLWTVDVFTDPDATLDAIREVLDAAVASDTIALPTIQFALPPDLLEELAETIVAEQPDLPETVPVPIVAARDRTPPVADDAVALAADGPADPPTTREGRRVRSADRTPQTSTGADRPLIPTRAREDEDQTWGGSREGSRDDDMKADKPPHW